ncbi:transcription factor BIM2-like isoform X2 [Iris pallida]|uniref:Transcription factor BIM2-like isoform X2 n=1 Tax=Iris pallida TaxID=29817 RepID=A0AAX6E7X0_IRIPA|nr:transcription factor BIM2-like isoform X2 [Iris pallida]
MESGSRSSRGFDDDEDEDDGFSRREGHRAGEMAVKVDGRGGSGSDQRATTPRSKHSATEQRRRSKINDRFQILRELIPHSDQKRDKATFLLEVIEYVRFLQEKVQKYETAYPGWNEDSSKLMPWNGVQVHGDNVADPSQNLKNGPSGFMYSDNSIPVAPAMLSTAQNPVESDLSAGVSFKAMENSTGFTNNAAATSIPLQPCSYASVERGTVATQPQPGLISDIDNLASQSQSQWLRPSCPADCSVSSDMLNGQEELTIDEGTINVSAVYSQNLLNTLSQALENSGIDLSQANVSVQINLGKRATGRRPTATTTMSSAKDLENPLSGNQGVMEHSRVGSSGEESELGTKRRKPNS